nr:MAG TPA: hypothetical protein [Caudoviricetes sp.]
MAVSLGRFCNLETSNSFSTTAVCQQKPPRRQ